MNSFLLAACSIVAAFVQASDASSERFLKDRRTSSGGTAFRVVEATDAEVQRPRTMINIANARNLPKTGTGKTRYTRTALGKMEPAGFAADSPTGNAPSRFTQLFREGARIAYLREWSFASDGGSVLQLPEYVTGAVNGRPSTLVARVNPQSGAYWTLNWTAGEIDYELGLFEPAFDATTADLLVQIAEAIEH